MKIYETDQIRNIVLLGHGGSGKTTLAESMLFESGAITRRGTVEEGNTVSDHYAIEKERGNSVFASLMHVAWKDSKINIIDSPGYDDFVSEIVPGLKVAGTGVMVVNSQHGVEVGTELIREYAQQFKSPLIFVINQVDHEKSNFNQTVEQIQERFGNAPVVQYPLNEGPGFNAIVDVLKMVVYRFPENGGKPKKESIPESEIARASELHEQLIEAIAEYDESLMEAFFDKGTLSEKEMTRGLKMSMLDQKIFPIFCVSAALNMGSGRIMGFLHDIAPAPADKSEYDETHKKEIPCDPSGPPVMFIYKTLSEPHLGEISYFKVISGTIHTGDELFNDDTSTVERINQLFLLNGKQRDAINTMKAGDLGVMVKLKNTRTNDTLCKKGADIKIAPIVFPAPKIRSAVKPPSKKDFEKMGQALNQIQKEDPTLIVEQSQELKQTILHGQGEWHLNIIKYRLEKLYHVQIEFEEPRIPYRETITRKVDSHYRHKKQSGGAGQFGEVHIRIEPYTEGMPNPTDLNVRDTQVTELPWGGKLVFLNCVVGGAIDAKYMSAITKGVLEQMETGPMTGSYVRDVRVAVYDGKMHSVDSNDMAFKLAGGYAFKHGFEKAGPVILEPIYEVNILCPDGDMGDIMSDLQSRSAMIMGMDREGHYQKIIARVPLRSIYKYSSTLQSISQGKAKHSRSFYDYQPVPPQVQDELIKNHRAERGED